MIQMDQNVFFLLIGWDWVHLVLQPLFGRLYKPPMIDDNCWAISGMQIGKGKPSTQRKPHPMPLCPPQIPLHLTRASAVGSKHVSGNFEPYPTSMQTTTGVHCGAVWRALTTTLEADTSTMRPSSCLSALNYAVLKASIPRLGNEVHGRIPPPVHISQTWHFPRGPQHTVID
jgi:hypothetical protein